MCSCNTSDKAPCLLRRMWRTNQRALRTNHTFTCSQLAAHTVISTPLHLTSSGAPVPSLACLPMTLSNTADFFRTMSILEIFMSLCI